MLADRDGDGIPFARVDRQGNPQRLQQQRRPAAERHDVAVRFDRATIRLDASYPPFGRAQACDRDAPAERHAQSGAVLAKSQRERVRIAALIVGTEDAADKLVAC